MDDLAALPWPMPTSDPTLQPEHGSYEVYDTLDPDGGGSKSGLDYFLDEVVKGTVEAFAAAFAKGAADWLKSWVGPTNEDVIHDLFDPFSTTQSGNFWATAYVGTCKHGLHRSE